MALAFNDNAVKRFTYDWLIRFAELHPFEIQDYENDFESCSTGQYNPLLSKYAAISPLFTTLITRYMPYIFHHFCFEIENCVIEKDELSSSHKYKIYVCFDCYFTGQITPGMLSLLEANRVIIYSKVICTVFDKLSEHTFTPNELKYLLKFGPRDRLFQVGGTFSEPFKFAEFWPLLKHCDEIRIEFDNLIVDENVATVLRENQVFPTELVFLRLNISDKAVLEMIDYFLSLPKFPEALIFEFQQFKPVELRKAITKKFFSAGFQDSSWISTETPEVPFDYIHITVDGSNCDLGFSA